MMSIVAILVFASDPRSDVRTTRGGAEGGRSASKRILALMRCMPCNTADLHEKASP